MTLRKGIYLVVDPSMHKDKLMQTIQSLMTEPIVAVQLWDNFSTVENPAELIAGIIHMCRPRNIPVLLNNSWELLKQTGADGIHFDTMQEDIRQRRKALDRQIITGITCNNDLSVVRQAAENEFDYISFCSMFPSPTANSCEIVKPETVRQAKQMTSLPIFLAGGITPENMTQLADLDYSGIAVVSGIMNAEQPREACKKYIQKLKTNPA